MRNLVAQLLTNTISRRDFVRRLVATGVTTAAANRVLESVTAIAQGPNAPSSPDAIRVFTGTGGEHFAEQLIASGVKYVFGNSASEDAFFYEALVDRPQLQYILTPHEGPGAAMAAGYIKASGQPAITMEAAVVGLTNALGQMFNCWKEQTPLVFYSYRTEDSLAAGRDGFEELPGQEQLTEPMTKLTWSARGAGQIAETVRRAFRVAWTPPYGPTYMNWHSDFTNEKVTAEVIRHDQVDPRMRVRPNPVEVQRAAKLLVDARRPVLIVGDEIYKGKAFDQVVKLAELLALPVTQARAVYANFPQQHPLWVGSIPGGRISSLAYASEPDVVINIGNKLQHNSTQPIVSRKTQFIDMRNDAASIGNVMVNAAPLVADVGYGTEDLLAALQDLLTPALRQRVAERAAEVRAFSARMRQLRALVTKNPNWDSSPLEADRVTWEIAQWAYRDAIVVQEAGSVSIDHSFEFDARGGRDLFFYYGAHLGTGVGTAAGVALARPGKQVICLVGDGSFIFGPTALWNQARLQLPVTTIVYNNHAYGGPHNRALANLGGTGRSIDAEKFVHDYLGKPDMDMASIAKGFGVDGERVKTPGELKAALARARRFTAEGKPYLIDVEVARHGPGWANDPWVPQITRA
jgi:benzoylformate decarboxylase